MLLTMITGERQKKKIEIKITMAFVFVSVNSLLLLSPDKVVDFGIRFNDRPVFFVLGI